MAKIKGAVIVNTERCKGCNLCVVHARRSTGVAPTRSKQQGVSLCVHEEPGRMHRLR